MLLVSETFFMGYVASTMPNPQPGGPRDHSLSGLYLRLTCSAWVALIGVQDSSQQSPKGHRGTQTASLQ